MSYTPPALDAIDFELSEYTAPALDAIDFELEEVEVGNAILFGMNF